MERIDEALARALKLLAEKDEPLAMQLASYFKERSKARHDLGNALSIAQASIEAMLDGVVEISDQRLERVRDVLTAASVLVEDANEPTQRLL